MFFVIRGLLLSWAFYFHKIVLGSMAQLFIDLNVGVDIW